VRWRHHIGVPIGGGVVTYRAGGRQLIAVAAGMHAAVTWKRRVYPQESWCTDCLELRSWR
jgi:hypothetical protein